MPEWRPVLIDHAAGFRREAVVTMEHENAFQTGPVRCVSASTYLRLRLLDAGTVAAKVGAWSPWRNSWWRPLRATCLPGTVQRWSAPVPCMALFPPPGPCRACSWASS